MQKERQCDQDKHGQRVNLGDIQELGQVGPHAPRPIEVEGLKRDPPYNHDRHEQPEICSELMNALGPRNNRDRNSEVVGRNPTRGDHREVEENEEAFEELGMSF